MIPLKTAIFLEVRKVYHESQNLSDDVLNKKIFHQPDSMRLSLGGFVIIKKIFTAYSFALPENLKSKHRLGMSKMEFPYFFTKNRLILFSEMDAMVITIHGGIEGFLEVCYNTGRND